MNLGLGIGLGMNSRRPPAKPIANNGGPELLLQAEILHRGDATSEGILIRAAAVPWLEIVDHLERDPKFLFQFVNQSRKFEEFIAATYERAGFKVTLTPQRGDKGVDVIAVKSGYGSVRFLDQCKAFSPGHRVSHNDVRALLGTLSRDQGASKALLTTTSAFQPGILGVNSEFAPLMPHRLELKDGVQTLEWIKSIRGHREP